MRCSAILSAALLLLFGTCVDAYSLKHLQDSADCQPWSVPPEGRCAYVRVNELSCYPEGGIFLYIQWHYCGLGKW